MIYFISDYSIGAHPTILEALKKTNMEHHDGYGLDDHCYHAADMIRELTGRPEAEVHFITGGTPANVTTIANTLAPYESVVAPRSGHIYKHETGAVEATGHKVVSYVKEDGKLEPADIEAAWGEFEDEHTAIPRMVYISQPTELGTIYQLEELLALRKCCDEHEMYLYIDGARLATALTTDRADATIRDIAAIADAFYIGGTKTGLLMGEAVVINNPKMADHYRFTMKQKNAMLAKGRLLGVQFEAILEGGENSLYYEIGRSENLTAMALAEGIRELGYDFRWEPTTNQIFPILPAKLVEQLHEDFMFYDWEPMPGAGANGEDMMAVRFVTNWATTGDEIEALLERLQ